MSGAYGWGNTSLEKRRLVRQRRENVEIMGSVPVRGHVGPQVALDGIRRNPTASEPR